MPRTKKPAKTSARKSAAKSAPKKRAKTTAKKPAPAPRASGIKGAWLRTRQRASAFLARRPHRSFRRTRHRDYVRSLTLPGYIAFTHQVSRHLWRYRKVFASLVVVYAILSALLVGLASQSTYSQLVDALQSTSSDLFNGGWGEVGKAGLLLATGITGSFSPQLSEAQQIFTILLFLMAWLTTVWLLRAQFAGGNPRLRDGLYSSGAPIFATVLVSALIVVQMLPGLAGILVYSAALSTDFFSSGVLAMLVALGALLLIVLSLYLVTSSSFALVVVTLPGMYPWQALRTAGDLVTGRRLRILFRLAWAGLIMLLAWIIVMLPIILLTTWLQGSFAWLASVPIVPLALALLAASTTVFMSTYIYLLYRKVIDDDAKPA